MQDYRAGTPSTRRQAKNKCQVRTLEAGTPAWETCQAAYVKRFPEAEFMTQLGDFRFVAIELNGARQVAGFGAARSIDESEVRRALRPAGQ